MGGLPDDRMHDYELLPSVVNRRMIAEEHKKRLQRRYFTCRLGVCFAQAVGDYRARADRPEFVQILWNQAETMPVGPDGGDSVSRLTMLRVSWLHGPRQ